MYVCMNVLMCVNVRMYEPDEIFAWNIDTEFQNFYRFLSSIVNRYFVFLLIGIV